MIMSRRRITEEINWSIKLSVDVIFIDVEDIKF